MCGVDTGKDIAGGRRRASWSKEVASSVALIGSSARGSDDPSSTQLPLGIVGLVHVDAERDQAAVCPEGTR